MADDSGVYVCCVRRACLQSRPDNHASLDCGDTQQAGAAAGSHTVPARTISHGADSTATVAVYARAVDG